MSKYPLRGEGLEVRQDSADGRTDDRRYTLVVDDHLFVELKQSFAQMFQDQADGQPGAGSVWKPEAGSKRWTFEYQVADEGFEAAAADTHCVEE